MNQTKKNNWKMLAIGVVIQLMAIGWHFAGISCLSDFISLVGDYFVILGFLRLILGNTTVLDKLTPKWFR